MANDLKHHGLGVGERPDMLMKDQKEQDFDAHELADVAEFEETGKLRQGLSQRHTQMIALAGTIGTGLFLGSGTAIARAGPLGALLSFTFVGLLALGPVFSVTEMSALVPLAGGIIRHSEVFFEPAMAFATGWNQVISTMVAVPAEVAAGAVLIDYWSTINNAVWITILGVLIVASNVFFVRIYGELEFIFAIIKILLILGVNLFALVIVCGGGPDHDAIGFRYWHNPGPLVQNLGIEGSLGRFLGFWSTFNSAVYAYSSIQNITIPASETKSPRRNLPSAAKRILWRIGGFYILSIFFVGLLVPSNDSDLLSASKPTARSPFVIAAKRSGVIAVPSIINAGVLTSAWSSANSSLLYGTRSLFGLAQDGRAPRVFKRINRYGTPWTSTAFLGAFIALAYLSISSGPAEVFSWLQALVSVGVLIDWIIICVVHLRFQHAMKRQGISRSRLPWAAPFQPWLPAFATIVFSLLLITGGWTTFLHHHWSDEVFISSYINIVIFALLYVIYKVFKKSKLVPLDQVPILRYIEIAERFPEPLPERKTGLRRLNFLWG